MGRTHERRKNTIKSFKKRGDSLERLKKIDRILLGKYKTL